MIQAISHDFCAYIFQISKSAPDFPSISREYIYIYIDHFIFPTLTNIHPQLTKEAYVLNNAVNSLQYLLVKGIK